jgi:flagellar biosynthesis protein FliR
MDFASVTTNQIQAFLLVFVRIATMISLLPIFGSQNIPIHVKAGFAFFISIILFPTIINSGIPVFPVATGLFILLIIKEIVIGIIIGFVSSLIFTIVQFAGYLIDVLTGFSFVELVDPFSDTSVSIFGQFNVLIFTILFFALNGHYFLLFAVQKSFAIIPLAHAHFPVGPIISVLITVVGNIFILGFKFAAPIFVTLLLTQISLAIVSRTVPQINVFFVGMPLNIAIGFYVAIIALPGLSILFKKMIDLMMQDIWRLMYLMA